MKFSKFVVLFAVILGVLGFVALPISAQTEATPEADTCTTNVQFSNPETDSEDTANFVAIRVYTGVDEANRAGFIQLVNDGFLPILEESEGFIGYLNADIGEGRWMAIRLFESEESAVASSELASAWVAENVADLLPVEESPVTFTGRVDLTAFVSCATEGTEVLFSNPATDAEETADFMAIRVYTGVDDANRAAFIQLVNDGFLPILEESEGFVAYLNADLGDGRWMAIRIFDNEESAVASSELASAWVAENVADLLPVEESPVTFVGRVDLRAFVVPAAAE